MVSLSEKVVLRAEDVINIMRAAGGVKWDTGLQGVYGPGSSTIVDNSLPEETNMYTSPMSQALDIKEIMREKQLIGKYFPNTCLFIYSYRYLQLWVESTRSILNRASRANVSTTKSQTGNILGVNGK